MEEEFILTLSKETPATWVFTTDDPYSPSKSLYVRKTWFPRGTVITEGAQLTVKIGFTQAELDTPPA